LKLTTLSFKVLILLHFLFHWTIWFLFNWGLDTPFFVNKIVEIHSSVLCLFVIKTIHPCGEYLVCCLLLTHYGAIRTNLEQIVEFGLWKYPSLKSQIPFNYFWWGCLVWIVRMILTVHNHSQMQGMDRNGMMAMLSVHWSQPI
jgi:hypothetical protein